MQLHTWSSGTLTVPQTVGTFSIPTQNPCPSGQTPGTLNSSPPSLCSVAEHKLSLGTPESLRQSGPCQRPLKPSNLFEFECQ